MDSSESQRAVVNSILSSQKKTVKDAVDPIVRYDYELTQLTTKSYAVYVVRKVDSAMTADGVTEPLQDSLHFIAAYYVAGYMKGAVWRDTATYYEWGTSIPNGLVRRRWGQLEKEWLQVVNAANTWDEQFFACHDPVSYKGHGYNTLYTRWYARNQPHKTHTIAFFLSPN